MNTLAVIHDLEKKVDDFHLGPIDLTIEPGTVTALIGNNGSGKSTLIKLMMNLAKPDMGNIHLFDKFVYGQDESWKQHVAYLPQKQIGFSPYNGHTLRELISGLYPNWDQPLFDNLIKAFQVPLDKTYEKLSPGAQQKLNLALTIPRGTKLMILDEPTNFMDIPSKSLLLDVLADWVERDGRALIFASHQVEDIRKLADYLAILKDGRQIGMFEKERLMETYQSYWINGLPEHAAIPGLVERQANGLVSDDPEATESWLKAQHISWQDRTSLDLEEIIGLLMKHH